MLREFQAMSLKSCSSCHKSKLPFQLWEILSVVTLRKVVIHQNLGLSSSNSLLKVISLTTRALQSTYPMCSALSMIYSCTMTRYAKLIAGCGHECM